MSKLCRLSGQSFRTFNPDYSFRLSHFFLKHQMMKKNIFLAICFLVFSTINSNLFAQSYVPQYKDTRFAVQPVIDVKAFAFDLSDVKLLPSLFTTAMQKDVNYLMVLNPDRFLSDFRSHAGLQPKAARYGGWESSGLAGHSIGHYLSALSMHYASTSDQECLRRVNYIVDQLEECQTARKTGYLGAIPNEDSVWTEVAKGHITSRGFDLDGAWSPWYTYHKIMAGLLDAYIYCHNPKALKVVSRMADWAAKEVSGLDDSLMQKMLVTEYGGMNDALVNLYAVTGKKKYLDLSDRFYDRRFLDSLALEKDILPGKHSNTQIPKIVGINRRFQLTGSAKDSVISDFFWTTVVNHHSYATGGNGNYEYFGPADHLNNTLTDNNTETCPSYNMLKLTGGLFASDPSSDLMDFYERDLYNHILSSQNHEDGMTTYFIPLRMGGKKHYSDSFNTFTCCVGTSMENHVKYGENIYYRGADGSLYINLFIPSELTWKERGVVIKQDSKVPSTDKTIFTIATQHPQTFAIRIRKPSWTTNPTIEVNGKCVPAKEGDDGYIVIRRQWNNGDKIEYTMPMDFYTVSMPDNHNRRAIFYGPILLSGELGNTEPLPSDIPVFVTNTSDANQWIKKDNNELVFHTVSKVTGNSLTLIPFNETVNEHYSVYWDVFTPAQWDKQKKLYEEEKIRQKRLEEHTVDVLRIGEMQPERDHNLVAEKTFAGQNHNRKFRIAREGGFFSFNIKVDGSQPNTLICTYWGMDNRGRIFDIYVDDTRIATEDINKYKRSKFYEIAYPIPGNLTKNKTSVSIKFVPKKGNAAGPVYGVKMVKGDITGLIEPN